jgi:hypothetical protein
MKKIGFSTAKRLVLQCLNNGDYQHEQRCDINVKNLLATGDIDEESIAKAIRSSKGTDHKSSPHHQDSETEVHIIKNNGWYIKFYFAKINPDNLTVFISVHR